VEKERGDGRDVRRGREWIGWEERREKGERKRRKGGRGWIREMGVHKVVLKSS
jgi:hypothetical protein